MIIGGLVDGTGLSASEVDAMTAPEAIYWWNCIMAYREHVSSKED